MTRRGLLKRLLAAPFLPAVASLPVAVPCVPAMLSKGERILNLHEQAWVASQQGIVIEIDGRRLARSVVAEVRLRGAGEQ